MLQYCKLHPAPCFQPKDINPPEIAIREPAPLDGPLAPAAIGEVCPMYAEKGMPLCCVNDQVSVMKNSFT